MIIAESIRVEVYKYDYAAHSYDLVTTLTESSIISASGKRQCCADGTFEIGGVYAATFSMQAKIPGMTSITYNINKEKTNVIMGSKICPLWGQTYITDYIGNVKYQISPLSFYQVNPVQTEVLYGTALEYAGLTGKETVWDVYCGIGTISLFLAQKAQKVYGVEIVPQAIEDAKHNAEINEITNAEFFVGKAEEVLP